MTRDIIFKKSLKIFGNIGGGIKENFARIKGSMALGKIPMIFRIDLNLTTFKVEVNFMTQGHFLRLRRKETFHDRKL